MINNSGEEQKGGGSYLTRPEPPRRSGITEEVDASLPGRIQRSLAVSVISIVVSLLISIIRFILLMQHGVDIISPSSWAVAEPQEKGMMSTAANFSSVRNQGLIVSRKKPNSRR
jgi:hypothetical protein